MRNKLVLSALQMFVVCCLMICHRTYAQKKLIENETYKTWFKLGKSGISNNGKYLWYNYSAEQYGNLLYLFNIKDDSKKIFSGGNDAVFTSDSQHLIFRSHDTLTIQPTKDGRPVHISAVDSFVVPPIGEWFAFRQKEGSIVRSLKDGRQISSSGSTDFLFSPQGNKCVLKDSVQLKWVDLQNQTELIILRAPGVTNWIFSPDGQRLIFTVKADSTATVYQFQAGQSQASLFIDDQSPGIYIDYRVSGDSLRFSKDGQRLFFTLKYVNPTVPIDSTVLTEKLDVWRGEDAFMQSEQLESIVPQLPIKRFYAVKQIKGNDIIQLESVDTVLATKLGDEYTVTRTNTNINEAYWNETQVPKYTIINLLTNQRNDIGVPLYTYPKLSPTERFILLDNASDPVAYEIITGKVQHLTNGIPSDYLLPKDIANTHFSPIKSIQWETDDKSILLCDQYDIWRISPKGDYPAVNLTKGAGRLAGITFRPVMDGRSGKLILQNKKLLLTAMDMRSTHTGFFSMRYKKGEKPKILTPLSTGAYISPDLGLFSSSFPIKAADKNIYLLQHNSDDEAAVPVYTTNFKSFTTIENIQPQQEYNWFRAELIRYPMSNGDTNSAILYKPENFDASKKYPVIFNYNENYSDQFSRFIWPELSCTNISIPWYTSHDYLVCIPAVHPKRAATAALALDAAESAVNYLQQYPWFDTSKMGVQGHGFGGYLTNYIASRSHHFAAAQSSAGASDLISLYGYTTEGGKSLSAEVEVGKFYMGKDNVPWDSTDVYVKNSPLFFVGKMKTPLLLAHNQEDNITPFGQSLEMYTALRRTQKPCWILDYDGEKHIINNDKNNMLDFIIRQQQFFNHYLKNYPATVWMVEGIRAAYKGKKSGLGVAK